jgi:hypothetical protein
MSISYASCIGKDSSIILSELLADAKEATKFNAITRRMEIADLLEIYTREDVIRMGYSPGEVNSVKPSTRRKDEIERAQRVAEVMHHVVGYEMS